MAPDQFDVVYGLLKSIERNTRRTYYMAGACVVLLALLIGRA